MNEREQFEQQLADWHNADEHQKIVEAIEALPEETCTAEWISILARAYNNLADGDNRQYLQKAIDLLERVKVELENDHNWNFRMAYAYYYLDQEGIALSYFEKALELRPEDADTIEFIDSCQQCLSLPRFDQSFRQRVINAWDSFLNGEAELRTMLNNKVQGEEIVAYCNELLAPAFADVSFELGFNGEKYELILTPEGQRSKLFPLVYFQHHVPEELFKHWNILVGRQPSASFELKMFERTIAADDVLVWVDKQDNDTAYLSFYSEQLVPFLQENENRAYWMLLILLDQIIGELASMEYIADITVLETPLTTPALSMSELLDYLQQLFDFDAVELEASQMCDRYSMYEMEPNQDEDADLRLDVFAGVTTLPSLIDAYLRNDSALMDEYHQDGIVPGFFYYPLDSFADCEDRGARILDFRDALEAAIMERAGTDAVIFIGGASGAYYGYLDFIAWDLRAVLDAAVEYFAETSVEWAAFHVFRRTVQGILLKDRSKETMH